MNRKRHRNHHAGHVRPVEPLPVLDRDAILKSKDLTETVEVPVPEWDGSVRLAMLNGAQREQLEDLLAKAQKGQHNYLIRATVAALSIVGEDGARLFKDSEIPALAKKSFVALDRIFDAALALNQMRQSDLEDEVGNSAADRNGVSGSI